MDRKTYGILALLMLIIAGLTGIVSAQSESYIETIYQAADTATYQHVDDHQASIKTGSTLTDDPEEIVDPDLLNGNASATEKIQDAYRWIDADIDFTPGRGSNQHQDN